MTKKKVVTETEEVLPEQPESPEETVEPSATEEVKAEPPTTSLEDKLQLLYEQAPENKTWTPQELAEALGVPELVACITWHHLFDKGIIKSTSFVKY